MFFSRASAFIVIVLVLCVSGNTVQESEYVSEKNMADCLLEGDFQCIKLRALADVYKLAHGKSLDVADGISLASSGGVEAETPRAILEQGWSGLFNLIPRMMKSLSLKLNIIPGGKLVVSKSQKANGLVDFSFEPDAAVEGRNDEKRKVMMSMMMFGGLYTTLFILGLAAAKLLAFKGVIVGAIALVISLINGLSRLANRNAYPGGYAYSRVDAGYGPAGRSLSEDFILNSISEEQ